MFRYSNKMIINVKGKVMEVSGKQDVEGQEVVTGSNSKAIHQQWNIIYTDKEVEMKTKGVSDWGFHIGRPFYIITKMGSGRAIEVTGGRNLVLKWKAWNKVSQQFFFDNKTKTIKSQ